MVVGEKVVRQPGIAEYEIPRFELCFLSAVIKCARALRLEKEVVGPRGLAHDVALLALYAAAIDRQACQLHRTELPNPQLCVEPIVIAGRELTLTHPGCIDLSPSGSPADSVQTFGRQKLHRHPPQSPALMR